MSHLFHFYFPQDELEDDEFVIEGEEHHHAVKVARVKCGERVGIINGKGKKWICEVIQCNRKELKLKRLKVIEEKIKSTKCGIISAWLGRDDSIETLITIGTEIGIDEFRFFQAERSIRPIKHYPKIEKWIVQSCKVTGRSKFPDVKFYENLLSALEDFHGDLFIAVSSENSIPLTSLQIAKDCGLIVGPEGDFTDKEIQISLDAGAIKVHLGPHTLRSEVASLLGCSIILTKQGNYDRCDKNILE